MAAKPPARTYGGEAAIADIVVFSEINAQNRPWALVGGFLETKLCSGFYAAVFFSKRTNDAGMMTNITGMLPKVFAHSLKVIGSGLAFTALSLNFIALRLRFSGRPHLFRGRATQSTRKALKVV